jgi:hypothetical protein
LKFDEANSTVTYRWRVDEARFAMPVRRRRPLADHSTDDGMANNEDVAQQRQFAVATDLYFVNVSKS